MSLLPSQNKVQLQDFKCKLPAELITDVHAYAMAINSDPNYVVTQALQKLTADKDFQTWKAANLGQTSVAAPAASQKKRGPKPKAEQVQISDTSSGKAVA